MYFDGTNVHIEEDDQCFSCEYFMKGVTCPLLEALAQGVVELQGDVQVSNCGFYIKFERHLKLVDPAEAAGEPAEEESDEDKQKRAEAE